MSAQNSPGSPVPRLLWDGGVRSFPMMSYSTQNSTSSPASAPGLGAFCLVHLLLPPVPKMCRVWLSPLLGLQGPTWCDGMLGCNLYSLYEALLTRKLHDVSSSWEAPSPWSLSPEYEGKRFSSREVPTRRRLQNKQFPRGRQEHAPGLVLSWSRSWPTAPQCVVPADLSALPASPLCQWALSQH